MTAPADAAGVTCQTCNGYGEITECVNDGTHGCSHVNDYSYRCQDCDGEGEIPPGPGAGASEEVPLGRVSGSHLASLGGTSDWPIAVVLAVCIFGALIFLALLSQGQRAMCATHHNQLRYCPGYTAGEGTDR